jgi:hypothetical protein
MLWRWLISILVWLSSDPRGIDREAPKAAAAVSASVASMSIEAPAPAPPGPTKCVCGQTCVRGVWKPDGRIEQRCSCECDRCRRERLKACTSGTCQPSR